MVTLHSVQMDRAVGVVVASAAGDALGSHNEFGPSLPDDAPVMFGVGYFGHDVGEWTDDTSMALPALEALSRGESLIDAGTLGGIVGRWLAWARTAKDIGSQTSSVFARLHGVATETAARSAARAVHEASGRSGGNGSLMRTGPVALGYLDDGREAELVEAAGRIAQLTHWEPDNLDACAIWCLAIRHAVRTGELAIREQVRWIPAERQERWLALIDEALAPGSHPRAFAQGNGWVVKAFQGALAAVAGSTSLVDALERAVRGGHDTDTVAAIAGSLAGAMDGFTQVPLAWQRILHGWPGYTVADLIRLALLAANAGQPTASSGWPDVTQVPTAHWLHTAPLRHPHDDGVWLGSQSALAELSDTVDAVVSLSRVGTLEIPPGLESIRVWLVDTDGLNANLDYVLTQVVDLIADLRAEGHVVFVHCAEARSRTAAVAALYSARRRGVPLGQAWSDIQATLPYYDPAPFLQRAVERIVTSAAPAPTSRDSRLP